MRRFRRGGLALLLFQAMPVPTALAASALGPVAHYNDGDSFVVSDQPIRLKGVDAPELAQSCVDRQGREYRCGERALDHLKRLVGGRDVVCQGDERDGYGRLLAHCRAGSVDLNASMVRDGWAVAFVRFDKTYVGAESSARKQGLGIWQGEFQPPGDFRAAGRERAKHPAKRQRDGCVIKGNIASDGDRIYHTPWGSEHYAQTRISTRKGERWFCSEAEARAAGWRPARR